MGFNEENNILSYDTLLKEGGQGDSSSKDVSTINILASQSVQAFNAC